MVVGDMNGVKDGNDAGDERDADGDGDVVMAMTMYGLLYGTMSEGVMLSWIWCTVC